MLRRWRYLAETEHETAYLSFLFSGGYSELAGVSETHCAAGTVIWHPSYDAHSDRFHAGGGHMLNLEISDEWLQETAQEWTPCAEVRAFSGGLPFSLGLRLYRELRQDAGSTEELAHELTSFFLMDRRMCGGR